MRRVNPADVKVRVRFKIAKRLGLLEQGVIAVAGLFHAGQDIVAGAVHHAHDAGDLVPGKAFCQRLDHGDAPGHGSFIADQAARGFGLFGQRLTVDRQQRLVGGDHILARGKRGFGRVLGGAFVAAHQFDKDIHIVPFCQCDGIILPRVARQCDTAVLVAAAGRDGGDGDGATGAGLDQGSLLADDPHHANPNGAQSGNPKTKRL